MKTAMTELIEFNDNLISEKGNYLSAYQIHSQVVAKALSLLKKEKQQIIDAYESGAHENYNILNGVDYLNQTFNTKEVK